MLPPKITYIISVLLQHNHELPWDTRQNHLCAHSRATHACTHARSATCVHTHLLRVLQPIQQPVLALVYLTVARKPYSLWTMGAKWTMTVQTQSENKSYFVSIPASMLPQSTREKTVKQEHTATENIMRSVLQMWINHTPTSTLYFNT